MFHDGKGFEYASEDSGIAVDNFLEEARRAVAPEQQLHAIWYVLVTEYTILAIHAMYHRFCISLAETRTPSKEELKVLEDSESIGKAWAELGMRSDLTWSFVQAPTIAVFTQLDRKANHILFKKTKDFSRENVKRLMPKIKEEALKFSLAVKGEVIGPDKNTERSLRFAVVGGLLLKFCCSSVLEMTMNCTEMDANTEEGSQRLKDLLQVTENAVTGMPRLLLMSIHTNRPRSRVKFATRRYAHFINPRYSMINAASMGRTLLQRKRVTLMLCSLRRPNVCCSYGASSAHIRMGRPLPGRQQAYKISWASSLNDHSHALLTLPCQTKAN